jgi:hypothetical protein
MNRLRKLTRTQWAVLLAVVVLAAGGVAAFALGGLSVGPSVKVTVTHPATDTGGATAPAPTATASTTTPTASAAPQGTTAPATGITPPPRAYTASPQPSPGTPAQGALANPPAQRAEQPPCPLDVKCTTMPCDSCAQPGVGGARVITDADNGKTVTIARGTWLSVQLRSTYWTIHPASDTGVLVAQGPQRNVACAPKSLPGSGCGMATVTFAAQAPGTAVVAAQRTSCGEAMLCAPDQSGFRVTVVVA